MGHIDFNAKHGFICDMDGVIYHGNIILPGVKEFIDWLNKNNKEYLFLTNGSGKSPRELSEKLERMGLSVSEDHFYTSALATASFLAGQCPGGTAYVTGIGEGLLALPPLPDCAIVVAQPAEGISTKEAYAAVDKAAILARPDNAAAIAALKAGDLPGVCAQAVNVFESATELAGVKDIRRRMEQYNPLCSQMTGSGSCVFAIFDNDEAAEACVEDLKKDYPTAFICHPCDGVKEI